MPLRNWIHTKLNDWKGVFEANELMRGPEGKMLKSKSKSDDFMFDDFTGDGLEFEAVELSLYGRNTK